MRARTAAQSARPGSLDSPGSGGSIGSTVALGIGLAMAVPALGAAFRGPRREFWKNMTAAGAVLGGWALLTQPELRRPGIRARDVALGLVSASALYATFQLGDRLTRRFLPGGDRQIREIYALRELEPSSVTTVRLLAVVAPAEELFWRGLVQNALMKRYGRWRGAALANLAYTAAHVSSGNFTLVGAAGVAGAHWSILYAAGAPLSALVVSHSAWDVWIFLIQPTGEVGGPAGNDRRPDATPLRPGAEGPLEAPVASLPLDQRSSTMAHFSAVRAGSRRR